MIVFRNKKKNKSIYFYCYLLFINLIFESIITYNGKMSKKVKKFKISRSIFCNFSFQIKMSKNTKCQKKKSFKNFN